MKKKTVFAGLFLLSVAMSAQEVISSQGNTYSNGTNTVDYTIGETVIATVSNGTNDVTQGFHQTKLTVTSIEDLDVNLNANIYPNPTSDKVVINMDNYENMRFMLFDASGKVIHEAIITSAITEINVSGYAFGNYLLSITDINNTKLKTYQIIKK
jgi:hypothetical protein